MEKTSYLEEIEFPILSDQAQQSLDATITLKEIRRAIGSLQAGKTPGEDGLPAEF